DLARSSGEPDGRVQEPFRRSRRALENRRPGDRQFSRWKASRRGPTDAMSAAIAIAPFVTALVIATSRAIAFVTDEPCPPRRLLLLAAVSAAAVAACFIVDMAFLLSFLCVLSQTILPLLSERRSTRVRWRLLLWPLIIAPFLLPPNLSPELRRLWIDAW